MIGRSRVCRIGNLLPSLTNGLFVTADRTAVASLPGVMHTVIVRGALLGSGRIEGSYSGAPSVQACRGVVVVGPVRGGDPVAVSGGASVHPRRV